MKVLFFTSPEQDYLQDSLLHGLRSLFGNELVDYPKKDVLYMGFTPGKNRYYGNGFTLYSLLENIEVDRFNLYEKIRNEFFDLIIFPSIQRQFGLFVQLLPNLTPANTLIFDGEDTPALYGYHGNYWRHPYTLFLPKAHKQFLYFKREWTPETILYLWYKLIPKWLTQQLSAPKNLRTISFSIPEEKIVQMLSPKKKLFPKHIVDEEVAANIRGSFAKYAFDDEKAYYEDLQAAKFGITTKRAGWDCLRHYEIAANGAVVCFRNLHKKPTTCAPHGLIPGVNCISYLSWDDLESQINGINDEQYLKLQQGSWQWAKENTTVARSKNFLKQFSLCK